MDTAYLRIKLKETLQRANMNGRQIKAVIKQFDTACSRPDANVVDIYADIVESSGNEDTATNVQEALASYGLLYRLAELEKKTIENKPFNPLANIKTESEYNASIRERFNLPNGLELVKDEKSNASKAQTPNDDAAKLRAHNMQTAKASVQKFKGKTLDIEVRK